MGIWRGWPGCATRGRHRRRLRRHGARRQLAGCRRPRRGMVPSYPVSGADRTAAPKATITCLTATTPCSAVACRSTATATPRRLELSNDADFDRVDAVRACCDAILVDAATRCNDNPRLLVRSKSRRDERTVRGCPLRLGWWRAALRMTRSCSAGFRSARSSGARSGRTSKPGGAGIRHGVPLRELLRAHADASICIASRVTARGSTATLPRSRSTP